MKFEKSQLAKLAFLVLMLLITPFISASLRPSYIYFLLNILIISLGVEAGLLGVLSGPLEETKTIKITTPITVEPVPQNWGGATNKIKLNENKSLHPVKVAEKPAVEKKIVAIARMQKVKRCPSKPSIFFIGSCEGEGQFKEENLDREEEEVEEVGQLSAQELFAKAETFIGNFYKQLKMQREDSWKKIHGLYHRAF